VKDVFSVTLLCPVLLVFVRRGNNFTVGMSMLPYIVLQGLRLSFQDTIAYLFDFYNM